MAFNLATNGCAMAHCDVRMSDRSNVNVGRNISNTTLMDSQTGGSSIGLGVVTNGNIIVATYKDSPELVKYDSNGNYLWSTTIFTSNAWKSAPMLSTNNDIIMADDKRIVRFGNNNNVVFDVLHQKTGSPVSPVLTSNGYIVLGLDNGEVVTKKVDKLPLTIQSYDLQSSIKNTPCVNGNSVFLSTDGGLKKVDISSSGVPTLVWTQSGSLVRKTGGASPLYLNGYIYFDASLDSSNYKYKIFKVNAISGAIEDTLDLPGNTQLVASIAQSPTGSSMYYYPIANQIEQIDSDLANVGSISLATLGGEASSAMTMASNNVMIVGAGLLSNAAVTAINLDTKTRAWSVGVGTLDTFGQFAIVNSNVFCTTKDQRLYKLS